ncbi:hypothetical protein COCOBI_18-1260 [Coccomyxa sp. Obi]|nr:hypothetical protein COCOBI_18-1260 [Coccomyxa sp. Obi]
MTSNLGLVVALGIICRLSLAGADLLSGSNVQGTYASSYSGPGGEQGTIATYGNDMVDQINDNNGQISHITGNIPGRKLSDWGHHWGGNGGNWGNNEDSAAASSSAAAAGDSAAAAAAAAAASGGSDRYRGRKLMQWGHWDGWNGDYNYGGSSAASSSAAAAGDDAAAAAAAAAAGGSDNYWGRRLLNWGGWGGWNRGYNYGGYNYGGSSAVSSSAAAAGDDAAAAAAAAAAEGSGNYWGRRLLQSGQVQLSGA